jgi:hypothetical protein
MFGMVGPNVVVQQSVQVNWDEIQGAANSPVPDVIEERLAREGVGCSEVLLNGRAAEGGGAGAAASGSG